MDYLPTIAFDTFALSIIMVAILREILVRVVSRQQGDTAQPL